MYMKNFGEFYNDQVSHASAIILSRTGNASEDKIAAAVAPCCAEKNPTATIVTTDWDRADRRPDRLASWTASATWWLSCWPRPKLANEDHADEDEHEHHHHHHHDEDGDEHECCHHHHDDDDDDDEHDHDHEHERALLPP